VALAVVPEPGSLRALGQRSGDMVVERVEFMLERSGAHGVERFVLGGAPGGSLARAAGQFDLLVIGCRATGGPFGHPTVRSVARRLMHSADVPVVVVPERSLAEAAPASAPASAAPS
jgi:nucleotide-binding universal stress UspA family protein